MLSRTASQLLRQSSRLSKRSYADMSFTFASQHQVFYNEAVVKQVDVPSFSGSFGILPEHVPTLAIIKPGVMTVYESDGKSSKYFLSSGTITVNDDSSVQVMSEEAVSLEDIDLSAAKTELANANADLSKAMTEMDKAKAQIAVDVAEAVVKAKESGQ